MNLSALLKTAVSKGASDLHLEGGQPGVVRLRGDLEVLGPIWPAPHILAMAEELCGAARWKQFAERRSLDFATVIAGIRCRLNVYQTQRGIALAIRLLAVLTPTVERLNLHPDFKRLVEARNGLVVLCGPTGSGKSSTLAGLVHEINYRQSRHVITLERPIEYTFRPKKSFIRQREVGRDTPSFARGLLDALREDPDVIVVGEMREPRTIRLTLNAAETGHLVLTTMHSGSAVEALQRIVSSFAPRIQHAVRAQLADCLIAVCNQKLTYRPDLDLRLPECEMLVATHGVKNLMRSGHLFKLEQLLETQSADGMWSTRRYKAWMDQRSDWHSASEWTRAADAEDSSVDGRHEPLTTSTGSPSRDSELRDFSAERRQRALAVERQARETSTPDPVPETKPSRPQRAEPGDDAAAPDVIEIQPTDATIRDILSELDRS